MQGAVVIKGVSSLFVKLFVDLNLCISFYYTLIPEAAVTFYK